MFEEIGNNVRFQLQGSMHITSVYTYTHNSNRGQQPFKGASFRGGGGAE